jgi:TRAP-type C4-dicarboxylate transport system substrate-binding protein
MKKISSLLLAASMALCLNVASAQTNLRVSHWLAPNAVPIPIFEKWLKSLEQASKGSLKVQVFPAGQLGKANDHYDMARDGIADLSWSVPGFNAGRFPIFGVLELPMLVADAPEAIFVFDQWYRTRHAQKEMSDVFYCMAITTPVSSLHLSKKEVTVPADLSGMRLRPQNATSGRFFSSLGSTIVQGAAAEVKQAVDRGLVDGVAFPWRTLYSFSLQNDLKFHLDLPLASGPSAWVMNRRAYNALPPDAKSAIDSHCSAEWARTIVREWDEWDSQGRKDLLAAGHKITTPNEAQHALWRAATVSAFDEWVKDADKAGINGRAELTDFQKRLRDRKAGF